MELWVMIFMLVVLKIPMVYVGWVVWWAIKAEPEPGSIGGDEGINWRPWRPVEPRSRRGGPHGGPERGTARPNRRRARMPG